MGKIWLQTTDNRLIHLPVSGPDVNTPDDPQRIPTSLFAIGDRCFSQPVTVVTPTHGTVTVDFGLERAAAGIVGSCNQCGQCCGHPAGDCQWGPLEACGYILHANLNWHVCQHLDINNWRKWGQAGNSSCLIHGDLINTFKGCIYYPSRVSQLRPWMTSCGYSVA